MSDKKNPDTFDLTDVPASVDSALKPPTSTSQPLLTEQDKYMYLAGLSGHGDMIEDSEVSRWAYRHEFIRVQDGLLFLTERGNQWVTNYMARPELEAEPAPCGEQIVRRRIEVGEQPAAPVKGDGAKPRIDLIPPHALLQVAHAMTHGAAKYGDDNYLRGNGLPTSRLLAAALRHLNAWQRGELFDEESGCSHLAHAAASVMMLQEVLAVHGQPIKVETDPGRH